MPRGLRDTVLDTRSTRLRLEPRRKPYWRRVSRRCHLGYRRNKTGTGSWVARFYKGERYVEKTLRPADDQLEADGQTVLDFTQAQEKAREWFEKQAKRAQGVEPEPHTVSRCLDEYLDWYRDHRKGIKPLLYTIEGHIRPRFGELEVGELTPTMIRKWHQSLAKAPPRLRSAPGMPTKTGHIQGTDGRRRRKVTANRILSIFKAALNHGYIEGRIASDDGWRRVRPFKGVESAKIRYLDQEEAPRFLNSCEPDFRKISQGALYTGCRYGELTAMRVRHYRPEACAVQVEEAKGSKPRMIFLTDEGVDFFEQLCAGHGASKIIFMREDGQPWGKSHQFRRMRQACQLAHIDPPIGFHILRHSYASLYLMNGGSIPGLAAQLGHADTRMTMKHYGHLAQQWRADEARRYAPAFPSAHGPSPRTSKKPNR